MGQHQVQRQLLRNFSFAGRQPNSRETWSLKVDSRRPISRSVNSVGFFEVDCSEEVDSYITKCEDKFKDLLRRFSEGTFTRGDAGRDLYDFIAMHYVRSQACRQQLQHMVDECHQSARFTEAQADLEYKRLASHQDTAVFEDMVDSVSRVLTHYIVCPVVIDRPWQFLTSDKIVCAALAAGHQSTTIVWFPISPSIGLYLDAEDFSGQILGPTGTDRTAGRILFGKIPEAQLLRFQVPSAQEGTEEFVTTLNTLMIEGSTALYAADRGAMDSALQNTKQPTAYTYLSSPR